MKLRAKIGVFGVVICLLVIAVSNIPANDIYQNEHHIRDDSGELINFTTNSGNFSYINASYVYIDDFYELTSNAGIQFVNDTFFDENITVTGNVSIGGVREINGSYDNKDTFIRNSNGNHWPANDTNFLTAIQEGGTVTLPGTTIDIDINISCGNGVTIIGQGNSTVLNFIGSGSTDLYIGTRGSGGKSDILFKDFKITGRGRIWFHATNTVAPYNCGNLTCENIWQENTNCTVPYANFQFYIHKANITNINCINCHVYNTTSTGFRLGGEAVSENYTFSNVLFQGCTVDEAGIFARTNDWVVAYNLVEHTHVSDVRLVSCRSNNTWESGFYMANAGVRHDVLFVSCYAGDAGKDNDALYGSGFQLAGNVSLVNCASHNCSKAGFLFTNSVLNATISITECRDDGSHYGIWSWETGTGDAGKVFINGFIAKNTFYYAYKLTNAGHIYGKGLVIEWPEGATTYGSKFSDTGAPLHNCTFEIFAYGCKKTYVVYSHSATNVTFSGYFETSKRPFTIYSPTDVTFRDLFMNLDGSYYGIYATGAGLPIVRTRVFDTIITGKGITYGIFTTPTCDGNITVDSKTVFITGVTNPANKISVDCDVHFTIPTVAPINPVTGDIYLNTTTGLIGRCKDGTNWHWS